MDITVSNLILEIEKTVHSWREAWLVYKKSTPNAENTPTADLTATYISELIELKESIINSPVPIGDLQIKMYLSMMLDIQDVISEFLAKLGYK